MSGCSNFLKESSQDEVIPETVYDYSELILNYMGYSNIWQMLFVLSDETQLRSDVFDYGDDYSYSMEVEGVFTWQPDMWETETRINSAYADTYSFIMGVNAILDGIDEARGDQETRDRVKAEALGLRGFYYFFLVNLFGEPYNYNKEAIGVPLKLTAGLVENGMKRNTVEEVYKQIVEDLETSSELFNQLPKTRGDYRINSTTVDIILSRVYLFMERYDDAITAANRAIASAEGLTDYTKLAEDAEFTMYSYDNSEVEAKKRTTVVLENKAKCTLKDMHFKMDGNPIGVTDTSLSFKGKGGLLSIVKNGRREEYPFMFGENTLIELSEKSSSPALSSASFNTDGTLSVWIQFIGECLGGLTFELGIKDGRISMRMRLVGELMFEGYSGVLTGTLE